MIELLQVSAEIRTQLGRPGMPVSLGTVVIPDPVCLGMSLESRAGMGE